MQLKLRPDQQEAVDTLCSNADNALVIAPTGSGKTIIAAALCESTFSTNRYILFLTPTNLLRDQQYESYAKHTHIPVFKLNSAHHVISQEGCYFATGHYAAAMLKKNPAVFENFSLLLLDETHKAWLINAPYSITYRALNCRVVGFTATPGSSTQYRMLKANLHIKRVIIVNAPKFNHVRVVNVPIELNELQKRFQEHFYQKMSSASMFRYFEAIAKTSFRPFSYKIPYSTDPLLKRLYALNRHAYYKYIAIRGLQYEAYKWIFQDPSLASAELLGKKGITINATQYRNPKFEKILEIVNSYGPQHKTLVFFELYECCELFQQYLASKGYRCAKLYGKARQGVISRRKNVQLIKSPHVRVILSTSVAQEGISIPGIDTVVFHSPITSPIRRVQRIGRTGRYNHGQAFILYYRGTHEAKAVAISHRRAKASENLALMDV